MPSHLRKKSWPSGSLWHDRGWWFPCNGGLQAGPEALCQMSNFSVPKKRTTGYGSGGHGHANGRHSPAPSPKNELHLELKRTPVWFKRNSTTADWICNSMKAALLLAQADSLCCALKKRQMTSCWNTRKTVQSSSCGARETAENQEHL